MILDDFNLNLFEDEWIPFFRYKSLILCSVFFFAVVEKYSKEQFVLIATNTRTRKKLLTVINKSDFACAIIYKNGSIVFFNDNFLEMFESYHPGKTNLHQNLPKNIYTLLQKDEGSTD